MGSFQPLDKARAEEIRQALAKARSSTEGVAFNPETGECLGSVPVNTSPDDRRNVIGKYDTHYGR